MLYMRVGKVVDNVISLVSFWIEPSADYIYVGYIRPHKKLFCEKES